MIELSTYKLNIKIGSVFNLSDIKVLDNSMEMDSRNYQVKIEGGKYTGDPKYPDRFYLTQIATYRVKFFVRKFDGNVDVKECLVTVEDVEAKINVNHKGKILTYKEPKMKLPSFTVSHPCLEYKTGNVNTSVKLFRTSFVGNDIEYTVHQKDGEYMVDLLEHGVGNSEEPCAGEYAVIYRAITSSGVIAEKVLSFGIGAEAKAAVMRREKEEQKENDEPVVRSLGRKKINVVIVALVLIISIVLGVFVSNIKPEDLSPGDDETIVTPGTGSEDTGETTVPEVEEKLEIVNPANAIAAFSCGEAYLKTAKSYEIEYVGNFYGSKEVAGKKYVVQETIRGMTKYYQVVYYNTLEVTKNADGNFGGNLYLRAIMPGANIVLSQMNKREKVFGDAWDETTVDKFALFLNRKAGKPYIKVDQSTVTNQISFSHDGNKWDYTLELDPNKALADYKPSINSMFNIFIDDYTYTIKSVKVTGSITARGGQPIKNKYEIVCGVTVTYKGIKINISNAMLTFTENFSKYNKVTQVEDEYVNPIS